MALTNWAGKETQQWTNGAQHTVGATSTPRESVTPTVGGVAQGFQAFGDASGDIRYLRITVNAGDDIVAGSRLANGYPEIFILNPGASLSLYTNSAIVRCDIVAIGDGETSTPVAGELVVEAVATSTEADYRSAMVTFEFDSADNVRTLSISASQAYSAAAAPATTANLSSVYVRGGTHE
jgi:hypothetical protein